MNDVKNIMLGLLVIFGFGQIYCITIISPVLMTYDKFKIFFDGEILHCGNITCSGATKCIITQKNDQNDNTTLITREKCFNDDDELVNSTEIRENAEINQNNVNIRIELGPNGHYVLRTKSDEELKEDAERLERRLEEIRLRNEERQKRLEERLAADAQRRKINMERLYDRLEREQIRREERLAADAHRREIDMEKLNNRLGRMQNPIDNVYIN